MDETFNPTSPREVVSLLERRGIKPRRNLGQNFLIDGNTVGKIVAAADVVPGEAVLEIGPGLGALTLALARCGVRVLALELDRALADLLYELLQPYPEAAVRRGDALEVDWPSLIKEAFPGAAAVKLVSNLPYYLSAPLLYQIMEQRFPFSSAVLMLQKEVAQRVTANPGDPLYGSLSVLCRYYTEPKILFPVSRNAFWPRPRVDSAVVGLRPREPFLEEKEEMLFRQVVQSAFRQRRKTLLNALKPAFHCPKDRLACLIGKASIDPSCRPEMLSAAEFAMLSRIIYNYMEDSPQ